MSLSDVIKRQREKLGLTLLQIAERMNVAEATVQRWESGNIKNIRYDKLDRLAEILQISPSELMGWDTPAPDVAEDIVSFNIIGDVAAHYEGLAVQEWEGEKIEVPRSWLRGRPQSDYFALRVKGDSMYPLYHDNDIVLVKRQTTLNRSGEIGVVVCDENATLKKVEYVIGEDWMKLIPINPNFPPVTVTGEKLEHCRVLGYPIKLIRSIND